MRTIQGEENPASILYKSIAGRYRPVSYPDGPITDRYRFIKNAYWEDTPTPLGKKFGHNWRTEGFDQM